MDLEFYKNLAIQKQKKHKKFLGNLKKKPPKNLDILVKEIHNQVFTEIDCLACACCCKTAGPLFTEKDIERISKHLRMKAADFQEKFLRTDEDGDKVFRDLPCPFLQENNECLIYEHRPKACREYPHTDRNKILQINYLTLKNAFICPAVFLWLEKLMKTVK